MTTLLWVTILLLFVAQKGFDPARGGSKPAGISQSLVVNDMCIPGREVTTHFYKDWRKY